MSREKRGGVEGGSTDPALFEELIRPFYQRIYRWAFTMTRDPDDADDVTQETVIRAYRHIATFRKESQVSTWLYRITRNVAMEMMSNPRRIRERPDAAAIDRASGQLKIEDSEGGVDHRQLLRIVHAFFGELSDRQREVFDLVDLQGREPIEAAEMLEIDAATARTHLFRARRVIRERIMEHYPEFAEALGR
ncbi:RNA polymerase sigma factor [Gemmatimonadota bacterium]